MATKEELAARVAQLEAELAEMAPQPLQRYAVGEQVYLSIGHATIVGFYSEDLTNHIENANPDIVEKVRVQLMSYGRHSFEPEGEALLCSFALDTFEKLKAAYPRLKAKRLNEIAKGGNY